MLKARIGLSDLSNPLELSDHAFALGKSVIRPFRHRLLITEHFASGADHLIVVRERASTDPSSPETQAGLPRPTFERALDRLRASELDFVLLRWCTGQARMEIEAGPLGSAPVYFRADGDALHLSWNPGDLLAGLDPTIDAPYLSRFLTGTLAFGGETVVSGLRRVTPASRLTFDVDGVRLAYPPNQEGVVLASLDADADPQALFIDAVSAILEARPLARDRTAVELSGGMDSAITSLVAAEVLGPGVLSYGVAFDGAMGEAQRARRRIVADKAGLEDVCLSARRLPLYDPDSARRTPLAIWPHDENYPDLFEPLIALCRAAGIDTLITGSGGDELYPLYAHETEDKEPAEPDPLFTDKTHALSRYTGEGFPYIGLLDSVWSAAAARSHRLLAHGIWPVYPFHNHRLANFTFRLPLDLRQDRTLHRRVLTRRLGSDLFERDYEKETFSDTLASGLERAAVFLTEVLDQSQAVAHGFVDRRVLAERWAKPAKDRSRREQDSLFFLLNFETFVRGQPLRFTA